MIGNNNIYNTYELLLLLLFTITIIILADLSAKLCCLENGHSFWVRFYNISRQYVQKTLK